MIQRIQTLWLLLAFTGLTLLFMFPAVTFHGEYMAGCTMDGSLSLVPKDNPEMLSQLSAGGSVVFDQTQFFHIWPLAVLVALTAVLTLVCIFLFKNRVLQMRLVSVAFLMNVVYVFLLLFWAVDKFAGAFKTALGNDQVDMGYGLGVWIPLGTIVLLMLAQRAIKKDESKVRAADRLR